MAMVTALPYSISCVDTRSQLHRVSPVALPPALVCSRIGIGPVGALRFKSQVGRSRAIGVGIRTIADPQMGTTVTEKMGIRIERNPSEARLSQLQVRSWPKWGCPPSKFPWTYTEREVCYLLEGHVRVYPDGFNDYVEFGAGDLVEFPKGMKCNWDVKEAVDKHYYFG